MTPECVVVWVTIPDAVVGARLAASIVGAHLAACVNRVAGVTSVYRFEGAVHTDAEELLIIKTRRDRVADLSAHIHAHHPYQLPEFLVLPILDGSPAYLAWVAAESAPVGPDSAD